MVLICGMARHKREEGGEELFGFRSAQETRWDEWRSVNITGSNIINRYLLQVTIVSI